MSKWEKRKLGGLTNIKTGKLDVNAGNENGIYPFFTCAKNPYKIFSYSYDCECVLVAGNGDLNVKYYNGKFDAYQRTYIIESKDKSKLFVPYMFHFLNRYVNILRSQAIGGVIKYIKIGNLTEALISLPPIETQTQIAKELDAASELLAMRKQQLTELDNLIKSVFYDMFGDPVTNEKGWIKTKIEDTAAYEKNAIKAGPFGSALKKEYYVKKGYKIYGQEQVINNDASYGDYYISDEKYRELENCAIKEEDVLISLVGTYGKLLIIPKEFEKGIINPRLMKITFNKEKINTMFFKYCFESESMKNIISDKSRGGTMDILNAGIVRKLIIPLPPIEIQNQFATKVTKIEAQKSLVKKTIEETQLLFDSLMSQYFD